nr:hypothetical protein [Streptomyces scopuliridis]
MTERRVNDPAGLTLSATDSQGATYTLTRDAFGRPHESADAAGSVTRLEWTPDGRLSRRTAPMDEEGDPIYFDYALVTSVDFRGPRGD